MKKKIKLIIKNNRISYNINIYYRFEQANMFFKKIMYLYTNDVKYIEKLNEDIYKIIDLDEIIEIINNEENFKKSIFNYEIEYDEFDEFFDHIVLNNKIPVNEFLSLKINNNGYTMLMHNEFFSIMTHLEIKQWLLNIFGPY